MKILLKQKLDASGLAKMSMKVLLIGLILVSCSAEASSSSKTTRFASVIEMRDAFIEVGGVCTNWETSSVSLAIASGSCSDASVLSIYSNRAVADEQNMAMKETVFKMFPNSVNDKIHLLVGENWILNDSDLKALDAFQKRYGGDLITSYSQISDR